ncbi:MAG: AI-2E family transporter [Nitrospirota bacterium]
MSLSIFLRPALDSLPFAEEQKDKVVKRVKNITFSTMLGGVVIAVAQGLVGGMILFVLGFSSPAVWGLVIAIVSFLPGIGHFVVWAPVAVYLLIQGEVIKGLGLIAAGVLGLGMIDDFVRPYVIGSRTKMPFPVLFFSVIGGIKQFGLLGFILGPMSLVLFISVMEVLRGIENDRRAEESAESRLRGFRCATERVH